MKEAGHLAARENYVRHLRQSLLFAGLDDAALNVVAGAARLRRVKDGSYFFHQGEPATVLYVLTEGRVKFTQVTPEGYGVLLRVIGPGETFGAVAALGDADHPASAQATGECAALGWESETISDLMERFPRLALNALRFLAGRLKEFQDRYRELATQRVERRIAHALLRLARQVGRQTEGGTLIDLTLSRQDIAEMSGTTLFTVSRTLSGWEGAGIIKSGRERVLILKEETLRGIAEDLPLVE
ncbi:MAG TPA: Crp/Fnr family transcriptional regulator [Chloroflexia bacterium]|nr:Crp/Fnr family transcriptional regulator [Chloroflexia bacterium]